MYTCRMKGPVEWMKYILFNGAALKWIRSVVSGIIYFFVLFICLFLLEIYLRVKCDYQNPFFKKCLYPNLPVKCN